MSFVFATISSQASPSVSNDRTMVAVKAHTVNATSAVWIDSKKGKNEGF